MDDLDLRLVMYAAWAIACVSSWGYVFWDDLREWRLHYAHRRRRDRGELISDFALLITSIASATSLLVLIVGQEIPGLRGFAIATALGAFAGAGIVKATMKNRPEEQ